MDTAEEDGTTPWMPLQAEGEGSAVANSWSHIPGSVFDCRIGGFALWKNMNVRCPLKPFLGPDYGRKKRKAPSGACLYDSLDVAIWDSPHKQSHVAQHIKLPK